MTILVWLIGAIGLATGLDFIWKGRKQLDEDAVADDERPE